MENSKRQRGFEVISDTHRTLEDNSTYLPIRGTKTSAGYDFFATRTLVIAPQQTVSFQTDVKAYMGNDEVLLIDVRSSMGIKHDLMITNTLGVIDSDYYQNEKNDGNISIGLRNLKPEMTIIGYTKIEDVEGNLIDLPIIQDLVIDNAVIIEKGERVAQGIFFKYLPADNCNTDVERKAGTGSTGK